MEKPNEDSVKQLLQQLNQFRSEQSRQYTIVKAEEQIFKDLVQILYQQRYKQSSQHPIELSNENFIQLALQFHQQIIGIEIELNQLRVNLLIQEPTQQSSQETSNLNTKLMSQELIEMEKRIRQLRQPTFLQSIQLARQQASFQLGMAQVTIQQNIEQIFQHLSQQHSGLKMRLRQLINLQTTQISTQQTTQQSSPQTSQQSSQRISSLTTQLMSQELTEMEGRVRQLSHQSTQHINQQTSQQTSNLTTQLISQELIEMKTRLGQLKQQLATVKKTTNLAIKAINKSANKSTNK